MSCKKISSYVLIVLFVATAAVYIITFYHETMQPASVHEEANKVAEAEPEKKEEHHEETTVKLSEAQIQEMGLTYRAASTGNLSLTVSTRGKIILHPDRLAHIIPKVSGVAREANKNIGNDVHVGEVMAVLESHDMADLKASYLAALSKKRLATSALEREEKLYLERVSSGQDYLNAKNVYEEASINVQLGRQKLRAFGLDDEEINLLADQHDPDLRLYEIRSPIDGTVIMRHIIKGEFVENTTTIYEVADLSTVWVEIGIYPKDLHRVKEGQMIEVAMPREGNATASQARLIYVSPIVGEETITAKAVAELDNPQGIWRPGVFVKVNIATEEASLPIVIPNDAIQNSEGRDFAFVVMPEGFEKRFIKVGLCDSENSEVLSGLNAGEQYVANKTFLLKAELGKSSVEDD